MKTERMSIPDFVENCKMRDIGFLKGEQYVLMDCSEVPVPMDEPLKESYTNGFDYIIAKVDYFNYSLMSKTEFTDFLYRYSQENTRCIVKYFDFINDLFS